MLTHIGSYFRFSFIQLEANIIQFFIMSYIVYFYDFAVDNLVTPVHFCLFPLLFYYILHKLHTISASFSTGCFALSHIYSHYHCFFCLLLFLFYKCLLQRFIIFHSFMQNHHICIIIHR